MPQTRPPPALRWAGRLRRSMGSTSSSPMPTASPFPGMADSPGVVDDQRAGERLQRRRQSPGRAAPVDGAAAGNPVRPDSGGLYPTRLVVVVVGSVVAVVPVED